MPQLVNHLYRFGEFALDADQKVLLRGGQPLPLAPKVVETLLYNAACAFSISGELGEAITCLEKSLPFCADRKWLDHDSYLDPLRSLPRFQELLRVGLRSASHS